MAARVRKGQMLGSERDGHRGQRAADPGVREGADTEVREGWTPGSEGVDTGVGEGWTPGSERDGRWG